MERLPLKNTSFCYVVQSYQEWLDITGYSLRTVRSWPRYIREMLSYLEGQGLQHLKELDSKHIKGYYEKHLKQRANTARAGALSNGSLNEHISSIKKFIDYLRQAGRINVGDPKLKLEDPLKRIIFLTPEEIQQLFAVTYQEPDYTMPSDWVKRRACSHMLWEHLASRDRAMLAVYYGCGLRRQEGSSLDVGDINFDRGLLHVRKGKGNKERFVPMSKSVINHIQEYLYDHRPALMQGKKSEALFITWNSKRIDGQGMMLRLKKLARATHNLSLHEKEIGLHTLRHTIATHLLEAGMSLENISRFLGHSSLESTQLYTHLMGLPVQRKQPFKHVRDYETKILFEDER